ncbi:uncharacterized protein PRCAT00004260001 [Priceomyces carsonii]|uniref:uncharacterized protein n=1 Tax=Priceomyces carsonii TaxID=28549 RepID=UPI002ED7DEFB|nr:unnamed protein product [Priceomyces carsonii]
MSKKIIVVGCGVMGLSTVVHLAERGDYEITAMDAYEVPSPWSAANDINKIIRSEYKEFVYTKLSVEATRQWRTDPIFEGVYKECGRILMTPLHHQGRQKYEKESIMNLRKIGNEGRKIENLQGGHALRDKFEMLENNRVHDNEVARWNPEAGLAHSANALRAMYEKAKSLGVKFIFGEAGRIIKVEERNQKHYVLAANGTLYTADQIVLSAGASSGYIVDLKQQQAATGLFVTHIQLTYDEYERFKNMPIVFDAEMGYFFPPDPETRVLKIALPGSGASNFVKDPFDGRKAKSLPRYKQQNPSDTIPRSSISQVQKLLEKYVPELAHHTIFNSKSCWIADTYDSHFIIDQVPGSKNLFVATGDSGHAFKFLPNIGKYIVLRLENRLDAELKELWRWKDETRAFDSTSLDWRVGTDSLDFSEIKWAEENGMLRCSL